MVSIKPKAPAASNVARLAERLAAHGIGRGAAALFITIAGLAALASLNLDPAPARLLLAGEIAAADIVADYSFTFKDSHGTEANRERIRAAQPLVCDLDPDGPDALRHRITALFDAIGEAKTAEEKEHVRLAFVQQTGEEIPPLFFQTLAQPKTQAAILESVLPWMERRFADGIIGDVRQILAAKGGVLTRSLRDGSETMHADPQTIPDIRLAQTELANMLRTLPNIHPVAKRAIRQLIDTLIAPTLTPNHGLTQERIAAALAAAAPVTHTVQKGEMIARQGERITREQQLKLQGLGKRRAERFRHTYFIGLLCTALIITGGMFFSPSGKASSPITQKDMVYIAFLVAAVALSSKATALVGQTLAEAYPAFSPHSLAYAMPLAGLSGLSAMLFSTRRFVTTGLLLALFGAAMHKGQLSLFLFYFLSAMWYTRLIVRTESRQEVVASTIPLLGGMYAIWIGTTFIQGGAHTRYLQEGLAVLAGGMLSMLLVFALSPLMEMLFGYVTRFRLMELLNMDQPVLRDLMVKAPGTYHHSLIVSQLAEAGAKAIEAHSMLCKVAGLYHDIGKIGRAGYFIENQFHGENLHEKLTPSMSALILVSHVKQGVELAKEHRLGAEVIDIIGQHHGTSTIAYFLKKAQELGENPSTVDFSYSGPKPQTREAALIMIADIVEASSRTLSDPTPSRLQTHINNVIKGLFSLGQLDETDITLKDLNRLSKSFLHVLMGIFHHRIKYPGETPDKAGPNRGGQKPPERLILPDLEAEDDDARHAMPPQ